MKTVIEINNLSKRFKNKILYRGLNLKIDEGTCVGFVGQNGAGKSVLFQLITGLLPMDSGTVTMNGVQIGGKYGEFPPNVGILINSPGYIDFYSGFRNLKLLAQINNIIWDDQIRDTMNMVGLDPQSKMPVKKYSMGMKQKLGIAQAIMENQSIIILDEPYNALDFQTNRDITDIINKLHADGKTILLTSHQHEYLEKLCDEIFFLQDGGLVNFDAEIKAKYFDI